MSSNITGRDGLITRKALAYAIEAIARLPIEWREASDREDMIVLLEALGGPKTAQRMRLEARATLSRRGIDVRHGEIVEADRPTEGNVVKGEF